MPDVTITISTPILTGSDVFRTRYRLVGGAYGGNTNRTNAPFSITGLAVGKYELEVVMVKNGVECPAIIKPFTVVADYTCQVFTPVIVQNGALFDLQISYGAIVTPSCGWQVILTGATTNKIINYASFPASPLLIPVANEAMRVQVIANLCDGRVLACLDTDVPPIVPTCSPMVITDVDVTFNNTYPNGFVGFSIVFTFTQSNPITQCITLVVTQKNVLNNGIPGQTKYLNYSFCGIPAAGGSFAPSIVANNDVFNSMYEFDWLVVDKCGVAHAGTVSKQL